jgi:hypothetical protein
MPVMDGDEAARRMKSAGYAGPILGLTADTDESIASSISERRNSDSGNGNGSPRNRNRDGASGSGSGSGSDSDCGSRSGNHCGSSCRNGFSGYTYGHESHDDSDEHRSAWADVVCLKGTNQTKMLSVIDSVLNRD